MATTSPAPDPEVPAKASRRRFTAPEKVRILDAYDAASAIEKAAIIRRERIYSSLLSNWGKQRASGTPFASERGRKADPLVRNEETLSGLEAVSGPSPTPSRVHSRVESTLVHS